MSAQRFNVVAVSAASGAKRVIATDKSERDAEAIIAMAVARRGVAEEFFKMEPAA